MPHYRPDIETFKQLAKQGNLIPIYRQLMSDQLTPVLAYRRLVKPDQRFAPSFLLESVVGGDHAARYSFLGAQPIAEIIAYGHEVTRRVGTEVEEYWSQDPLAEMEKLTSEWELAPVAALPEFTGGWVGFAGYGTVRYAEGEKLDSPPDDDRHLPDLHFGLYQQSVVFDHVQKTVIAITHVLLDEYDSVEDAYAFGCGQLDQLVSRFEMDAVSLPIGEAELDSPPRVLEKSNMGEGGYQEAVLKIKEYIGAGDAFQIVPSQCFEIRTEADPFDIYRALRVVNPSPYMFYLQSEGCMLVGSSPEILVNVENGKVTNRPLAGTRRRGLTEAEDQALEADLLADPKEQAEHIMLVDLGRNDVGRIAELGSIELPVIMEVERYSHVMHISSTVTGQLKEGANCWDALRMTLPVGTVSGAPKIRAMQIIDEVEPTRRGPYAGAVGYADFAGNMDMAIALRTMVVMPRRKNYDRHPERLPEQWVVHLQAGAGIVADSDPDAEHQETVNKAAALAKAIDLAEQAFGE